MNEPFAFYEKTAEYVKQRAPFVPEIALILGTGLGPLAGQIENPVTLDSEFSGFHRAGPRRKADLRHARGKEARVHVRKIPYLRGLRF